MEELQNQIESLKQRIAYLERQMSYNNFSALEIKEKAVQFNGSVGFYRKAPIVQALAITAPSGGSTSDAEARTAINSIITCLQNLGLTK